MLDEAGAEFGGWVSPRQCIKAQDHAVHTTLSLSAMCAAVKQAGAEIIGDGSGLRYKGWAVETCKAPISSKLCFTLHPSIEDV